MSGRVIPTAGYGMESPTRWQGQTAAPGLCVHHDAEADVDRRVPLHQREQVIGG